MVDWVNVLESVSVVEFIEMRHLAWMGGGKLISGFAQHWKRTQNPASKGPDSAQHTPIEPLLTRVLRCNMGGGVFVWAVESQKQIFGVVGNLRSPALAGWQGPGAGAVNIQICPNPPANYWRSPPKKVWLTVGPLKSSTRLKKKNYSHKN